MAFVFLLDCQRIFLFFSILHFHSYLKRISFKDYNTLLLRFFSPSTFSLYPLKLAAWFHTAMSSRLLLWLLTLKMGALWFWFKLKICFTYGQPFDTCLGWATLFDYLSAWRAKGAWYQPHVIAFSTSIWPDVELILVQELTELLRFRRNPNLGQDDSKNLVISWSQFCREPLPDRNFTFWEWFYRVMNLTSQHMRGTSYIEHLCSRPTLVFVPFSIFRSVVHESQPHGLPIANNYFETSYLVSWFCSLFHYLSSGSWNEHLIMGFVS